MRILHVSEVQWGGVVSLIREDADAPAARGDVELLAGADEQARALGGRR